MNVIAPTITATNAQEYREQMARIAPFAKRVHIDFSDGQFAPVRLINPIQAYWPEGLTADFHFMFTDPKQHIETAISLRPDLVIIHAEAQGDLIGMMRELRAVNIKVGVAFLQQTDPSQHEQLVAEADHVLIFSGNLGHQGGSYADLQLLSKLRQVKAINSTVEIGWDGGINSENIAQLVGGGVEVLNVGGAIHLSPDPKAAYQALQSAGLAVHTD
jgi:ribulose-phosphate 3-epimerase